MAYLIHKWIGSECLICGITTEQFEYVAQKTALPSCTHGDVWHENQSELVDEEVIGDALRLYS